VRYSDAALAAPPGRAEFEAEDVARLPRWMLRLIFEPGPAAPPLEEVAAALRPSAPALLTLAATLPPARGERLLRLGQRPAPAAEVEAARERLVAALFWPLIYALRPDDWLRLADAEPVHPQLVADLLRRLPSGRVVETGAGGGRMTGALAERADTLLAIEPVARLAADLAARGTGTAAVLRAVSQDLPLPGGWADAAVACASLSPHPPVGGERAVEELERVVHRGGLVALIEPEAPAWFQARGYELTEYPAIDAPAPAELVDFFGPLDPPRRLLLKIRP
jgi:hypothetical protein